MMFAFGQRLLRRRRLAIVLMAVIMALIALQTNIGQSIDRAMADARAHIRDRAPSGRLVLVELDRKSLRNQGTWPWSRRVHAALVDRLIEAGAAHVAFDMDFSSRSNPADDRLFADAIRRAQGRVILGSSREHDGPGQWRDIVPIPELAEHARVASISTPVTSDGFVRSASTGIVVDGQMRLSIPALITGANVRPGSIYRLDMATNIDKIDRISADDIVNGRFDPARVRGKAIIIGATAPELGDRAMLTRQFPDRSALGAPLSRVQPGVMIHFLGAETLIAGRAPLAMGARLPLLVAFFAVVAIAFVRSRMITGAIIAAAAFLLVFGPLVAEMTVGWIFLVMPALMMLFAGVAVRGIASLARTFFDSVASNELSGLANAHALHFDAKNGEKAHLAVARINDLNAITAVLGERQAGDLLRRVAERIGFIAEDAKVYHVSDAMFAWLIPSGSEDEAPDRFEALSAILSAPIKVGARPVDIVMNYGLCTGETDLHVALRGAVLAAERAAERGVRWQSHSADEQDEASWRMSLLGELDGAIDSGQIWVAYQPKYDLKTGATIGAEALVRWLHPERGAIRPDSFIPLAEESGRIAKLTRHVLDTALGDFATISSDAHRPVVAVNLSTTLLSSPNLIEMICDALWRNGLMPDQLILEVTESAAMSSDDGALAALERLRAMGIGISIDDYGTGQSTLNYLKRLPATELKIDQSFIRAITESRSDEILVNSTIQLGHQLGMKVVAEGVETSDVLERLEAFGCDVVQGYLIGKPAPFATFSRNYRPARAEQAA